MKTKGFMLIELIIVLILVGLLASLSAPMMNNMKAKTIAAEAQVALAAMARSLQQYYVENGEYPASANFIDISEAAKFPGLFIRTWRGGGYNPGVYSLDGHYFSQENYAFWNQGDPKYYVLCWIGKTINEASGYADTIGLWEIRTGNEYLMYNLTTKTFKQYGCEKTGWPPGGWPPDSE